MPRADRPAARAPLPLAATDKLSVTLCLAIVIHFVLILGISFTARDERPQRKYNTMEIVMVRQQQPPPEETPEANLLAQANLLGGADGQSDLTPEGAPPAPFPAETPELSSPPAMEAQTVPEASAEPESAGQEPEPAETPPEDLQKAEAEAERTEPRPEPAPPRDAADPRASDALDTPPLPSAAELIASSFQIAALSAEIKRKLERKAKRPRRKFISATTREYKYAAYMDAWRAKVERIGNLNYPREARDLQLYGNLILDVALRPDGSVIRIAVKRSSGNRILDDAAVRIVRMAAPFAPFPQNIRGETDILHITRTWQFLNTQRFR